MKHADALAPILEFLERIELICTPGEIAATSFLPGVAIRAGALVYDAAQLAAPGDLLHEAGRLAAVPIRWRLAISDDVDASLAALAQAHPEARGLAHTDLFPSPGPRRRRTRSASIRTASSRRAAMARPQAATRAFWTSSCAWGCSPA